MITRMFARVTCIAEAAQSLLARSRVLSSCLICRRHPLGHDKRPLGSTAQQWQIPSPSAADLHSISSISINGMVSLSGCADSTAISACTPGSTAYPHKMRASSGRPANFPARAHLKAASACKTAAVCFSRLNSASHTHAQGASDSALPSLVSFLHDTCVCGDQS